MAKILVADDERSICDAFRELIVAEGHTALVASNGTEALRLIRDEHPQAAFIDYRMPGIDGLEVLEKIHALDPTLPVTIMTAFGTLDTAARALRASAFDYLGKPLELSQVRQVLRRALSQRPADSSGDTITAVAPGQISSRPTLVGTSRGMQELFKLIVLLAASDLTVLVQGESGVGKELVARAIHDRGPRALEPFIAVNCAALPEALLESELFGHERGAFTDARELRRGRFESAAAGTLFLDEISELPLHLQSKLLRALQERSYERIGSVVPIALTARIIVATNRDLAGEVQAGRFRADLYHRLNQAALRTPPLRERKEDLPELAAALIARANVEVGRQVQRLEPAALQRLMEYDWPGNVRELEHVIKRSILTSRGQSLSREDLVFSQVEPTAGENTGVVTEALIRQAAAHYIARALAAEPTATDAQRPEIFQQAVEALEQALVRAALEVTNGNQVAAARLLKVSRTTLRAKLTDTDQTSDSA